MLKRKSCKKERNYWRQDIKFREYLAGYMETVGITGVTAFLFYRSLLAFWILLLPIGGTFLYVWEKEQVHKKEKEFTRQFLDALQSVSAALNVGYSLENSMSEAQKELALLYGEQERIMKEWNYMLRQLNMNIGMEEILEEFSERVPQEDVRNFVTVIATVKKSGGNLARVMRQTMTQIQQKIEMEKEIATVIAAKKLEFVVMSLIPFGMIAYMLFSFPEFMQALYRGVSGRGIMTGCLLVYLTAFWCGFQMIQIEV